jgi:glycosyltransferase involved in cell wall biosynthesis
MKAVSRIDVPVVRESAPAPSSIKVCMHVLGTARTDVRVMREAIALVEAGFDVSIVDVEAEQTRPVEEQIHGVRVKHIMKPRWFGSTRFKPWFLVKAAGMFIRGMFQLMQIPADIYHAHDETAFAATYVAARLRRKHLIFDAHELPFTGKSVTRWRRLHALAVGLVARMAPYCVGIITVSQPIAQEIHSLYQGPEVTVIRNIPMYRTVQRSDRLREYLGLSPETRIALFQGAFNPDRELDRLVRSATFLDPDIVIVMMGNGPKAIQLPLEALVESEQVAERVKIIPPVPYEELLDWTASADIGLIIYSPDYSPNIRMCLPNKFFEYLMAGLPILSSQLDVVADLSRTYDVGQVVSSLTPTDIAAAINTMLADPVALDGMRRNALESARRVFNWGKERQLLIHLYDDILTKRDKQ